MIPYRLSEWESCGRFYCSCIDNLGQNSGYWGHLPRVWGLTPAGFVKMLIEKYKPDNIEYRDDILIYSWNSYFPQHQFLLDTNKRARNVSYKIKGKDS